MNKKYEELKGKLDKLKPKTLNISFISIWALFRLYREFVLLLDKAKYFTDIVLQINCILREIEEEVALRCNKNKSQKIKKG